MPPTSILPLHASTNSLYRYLGLSVSECLSMFESECFTAFLCCTRTQPQVREIEAEIAKMPEDGGVAPGPGTRHKVPFIDICFPQALNI